MTWEQRTEHNITQHYTSNTDSTCTAIRQPTCPMAPVAPAMSTCMGRGGEEDKGRTDADQWRQHMGEHNTPTETSRHRTTTDADAVRVHICTAARASISISISMPSPRLASHRSSCSSLGTSSVHPCACPSPLLPPFRLVVVVLCRCLMSLSLSSALSVLCLLLDHSILDAGTRRWRGRSDRSNNVPGVRKHLPPHPPKLTDVLVACSLLAWNRFLNARGSHQA